MAATVPVIAAVAAILGAACKRTPPPLQITAEEVSREQGIPSDLLLSIVYVESRLSAAGDRDVPPGWVKLVPGRRDPARAAQLLDIDLDDVVRDRTSNLRAGAALLADAAKQVGVARDAPPRSWLSAIQRFCGGADPFASALYAYQVLAVRAAGFRGDDDLGNVVQLPGSGIVLADDPLAALPPRPPAVVGASFAPYLEAAATTHRPLAATPRKIKYVIIHTTQNTFPIIVDYFRRPTTKVASHYLVRSMDGATVQLVDERLVAFHDACFNEESIGIEHEGYVHEGNRWYSDKMYRATAKLVRDIATRHDIPLDRQHILGHDEAPDCSDHTDPGPQWDWDKLMRYVANP